VNVRLFRIKFRGLKEQSAQNGVRTSQIGEQKLNGPGGGKHQVLAIAEVRHSAGIQNLRSGRVQNVYTLRSASRIPIQHIDRYLVGIAVGEIDVNREAGAGVPSCGDTICGGFALLQSPHIAG